MKPFLYFGLLISCFLFQFPQMASASQPGPYELCLVSYKNETKAVILKYNNITGQSWILNKQRFESIAEQKRLPSSVYKIKIIPFQQGWFATRMDTKSGKTWKFKGGIWVEY